MVPTEIAEYVDTPRSSVYRLGDALRDAAMIEQVPDAHLRLSLRWLRLADAARAGMSEWDGARTVLDELAGATRQTVFLTVPRANEAICIDWARGEAINVLLLKPGRALPLYAGAAGRVTLAFGRDDPTAYLAKAPFEAYTDRTLTTAAKLRKDVILDQDPGLRGLRRRRHRRHRRTSGHPCSGRPREVSPARCPSGVSPRKSTNGGYELVELLSGRSVETVGLPPLTHPIRPRRAVPIGHWTYCPSTRYRFRTVASAARLQHLEGSGSQRSDTRGHR